MMLSFFFLLFFMHCKGTAHW